MKRLKIFSVLALLLLVSSLMSVNLVNADVNQDKHNHDNDTISPMYVVYCPDNANGAGKHKDTSSSLTKAKINGSIYNAAEWNCSCGAAVMTVPDYGNVYFYSSDATMQASAGFPYLPGSYQYYQVNTLRSGSPIDWQTGW